MKFGVKSDRGMQREKNEDNYDVIAGSSEIPFTYIIADGMGGHNSGEVASKMAVDYVSNYIHQSPGIFSNPEDIPDALNEMMQAANRSIYNSSIEEESNRGMGTTLIIAVVCGGKLYIGHVGDSRAYLIRESYIERLTTDHSYIEELIRNGSLTRKEAENHPQKNVITRALGCSESIEIDTYTCEIKDGDIFLLCTDGLTNMLDEEQIRQIITKSSDPEEACAELVDKANSRGGDDNITVIVFKDSD